MLRNSIFCGHGTEIVHVIVQHHRIITVSAFCTEFNPFNITELSQYQLFVQKLTPSTSQNYHSISFLYRNQPLQHHKIITVSAFCTEINPFSITELLQYQLFVQKSTPSTSQNYHSISFLYRNQPLQHSYLFLQLNH